MKCRRILSQRIVQQSAVRVRSGMTLLELMIGIVVMGAAVAAGYATFATVVDQKHHMEKMVDDASRGAVVRRLVSTWIQSSLNVTLIDAAAEADPNVTRRQYRDNLRIITAGDNPTGKGITQLLLEINENNPRFQRGLVAKFIPFTADQQDTIVVVLDSTVTGIKVDFMRMVQGISEWVPSNEWVTAMGRPVAVRIYLIANDQSQLTPLLHIPITVRMLGAM